MVQYDRIEAQNNYRPIKQPQRDKKVYKRYKMATKTHKTMIKRHKTSRDVKHLRRGKKKLLQRDTK